MHSDPFILRLYAATGMSARRFRMILNSIRLYDKEVANEQNLGNRESLDFDEHHKVIFKNAKT